MISENWQAFAAVGLACIGLVRVWQEHMSARVKLRSDVALLKEVKAAGIDDTLIREDIERRIKAVFNPEEGDPKDEESSAVGEVMMIGFCLLILYAGVVSVSGEIRGVFGGGGWSLGELMFGLLISGFSGYGVFVFARDLLHRWLPPKASE